MIKRFPGRAVGRSESVEWDAWIGADNWPQRACVEARLEGDTKVEIVALAAK